MPIYFRTVSLNVGVPLMRKIASLALSLACSCLPLPAFADATAAARFYEDGLTRYNAGDLPGAIIQLKNALQQQRDMLAAQLLLARAYFDDGDLGPAEVAFGEALKLGVDRSEVVVPMMRIQIARGQAQTAIDRYPPDGLPAAIRSDVLALRGVAYAMLGRPDESAQSFEAARNLRPDALLPLLEEVPLLIGAGRLEDAEARARRASELQPQSPAVWDALGRVAHARGDLNQALEHYGRAVSLDGSFVDARVTRAGLLLDLGRDAEARADVDALAAAGVQDARATYLRALLAERGGDTKAAREHLAEVTRLVDVLGRDWIAGREVFLMLGALSHHAMGNLEKARGYLNMLVARFPGNQGARRLLAAIQVDAGDFGPARTTLEDLVRRNPRDVTALTLLGRIALAQGRTSQGVDYLERANAAGGERRETQIALGFGQLASGDAEQAILNLEKALDLSNPDPRLVSTLTTLYMRGNNPQKALDLARKQIEVVPGRADAHNLLGVLLGANGDLDGARASYEKALALAPGLEAARFNLVRVDVAQGHVDAARKTLETMLARDPKSEAALFELGMLELRAGRIALGIASLEKALAAGPANLRVGMSLAEAHLANGDAAKASEVARGLASRHAGNVDILMLQARIAIGASDSKLAAGFLREATRLAEFSADRLVAIGRLQRSAGLLDDASYSAHKALTGSPTDGAALVLSAELALAQQRPDQATAFIDRLATLKPRPVDVPRLAAEVALARGDLATAEAHLAEAHAVAPSAQLLARRVHVWLRNDKTDDAVKAVRAWLELHPDDRGVQNLLGELHMRRGDWKAAAGIYRALVGSQSASALELNNLANILIMLGEPGALEHARRALALAPGDPLILDTVGWLTVKDGALEEGVRLLREARLRMPEHPEIRYHLAYALVGLGRRDEALRELGAALESQAAFNGRNDAEALWRRLNAGS